MFEERSDELKEFLKRGGMICCSYCLFALSAAVVNMLEGGTLLLLSLRSSRPSVLVLPHLLMCLEAMDATRLESSPPERRTPQGTSLIILLTTAFSNAFLSATGS